MTRRQILAFAVMTTGLLGVGATLVPLLGSLKPSGSAGLGGPELKVSTLAPGTAVRWAPWPRQRSTWRQEYIVLKDYDSAIHVYSVPTDENGTQLPERQWWRLSTTCEDFGPDIAGGKLKPTGLIRCHDADKPYLEGRNEFLWTYEGRNLGHNPDMLVPLHRIEAGYLVLGRP